MENNNLRNVENSAKFSMIKSEMNEGRSTKRDLLNLFKKNENLSSEDNITVTTDSSIFNYNVDTLNTLSAEDASKVDDILSGQAVNQFESATGLTSTRMPAEFENFLQSLGLMVYKYKVKPTRFGEDHQDHGYGYFHTSTPPTKLRRNENNNYRLQKEALKDALMMKLVSYYEDKYQITPERQDIVPQNRITKFPPIFDRMLTTTQTTISDIYTNYDEKIQNNNSISENVTTIDLPTLNDSDNANNKRNDGNDGLKTEAEVNSMLVQRRTSRSGNIAEVVVM